ncbi:2Fe-2S iron-sulfur cluster-binding protein [Neptunomonas antarctica]|uniref:CDP-4-dehydro-6-deoxyglucose reductase n=1 Tax=Neptunomonas antarctica TaxID=619304 RepID=A0A1N7MKI9_9GAMM|nr:2Fe-2S iron-sulfur cluster-binding protein [Neptunomonas antarctica]SIS86508.1 CDP-4-dehydro-6-deoxyglucose reductase [Neptunomonas antarctica]
MSANVKCIRLNDMAELLSCNPDETLLQVVERYGYRMPRSCQNGVCQICEYQLLSGEVRQHYPQKYLTAKIGDSGNNQKTPLLGLACTSIPVSDCRINIKGLKSPGEQEVKRLNCDIAQIEKLNKDVYRVSLVLPATASQSVEYYAGQYLEIVMPDGQQAAFSIGSAPEAGRNIELHVRHAPDSVLSTAILAHLQSSKTVTVELPQGDCYLRAGNVVAGQTIILAAASTGFSQIKSMMEHLLAQHVKNPIHLYWGARVAADLYLSELPKQWAAENDNVTYHPVVSEPGDSCGWTGRVDLLPRAIQSDFDSLADVEVYTSGSPAMVYALLDACEEKGLKQAQMHSDVFAYAPRPEK